MWPAAPIYIHKHTVIKTTGCIILIKQSVLEGTSSVSVKFSEFLQSEHTPVSMTQT